MLPDDTELQESLIKKETTQDGNVENSRFNVENISSDTTDKSSDQTHKSNGAKDNTTDSSGGKSGAGTRVSTVSTRFNIQRQNTEILANEKEREALEKNQSDDKEEEEEVFKDVESYTERIEKILIDLNVHATSLKTKDNDHILVTFCLENSKVEDALLLLQENGIGNSPSETSISVMPVSVHLEVPLENNLDQRYQQRKLCKI